MVEAQKKPADPTAGHLEFANTVEGALIKNLGKDLTPALRLKLRAAGLDLDKKLLPGYPAKQFHGWLVLAATEAFPGLLRDEAVRKLGRRSITGLGETALGKALKGTLSLIGPRRALQRAQRAFRSNNNYMEVETKELSPTALELTFNWVHGLPTYYQGVLEGGCELLKARNAVVRIMPSEGPGARYLVSWEE